MSSLNVRRGFFCADQSLRYPYKVSTISVPLLLVAMVLLPLLFIALAEALRACHHFRWRRYALALWRTGCSFLGGSTATFVSCELAKRIVGRLRPHFYAACQPRLPDGSTCDANTATTTMAANSIHYFVVDYECSNRDLTSRQLRELQVSFPSAHAALSFYAMLFLCFYLHAIWPACRRLSRIGRLGQRLLQLALLLLAWSVALSRVADYWHHWSDVVAGALLGITFALLAVLYVGGLPTPSLSSSTASTLPPLSLPLPLPLPSSSPPHPETGSTLLALRRNLQQQEHRTHTAGDWKTQVAFKA